ncbi:MAG: hypothetical protein ACFFF4_10150 [Candidatus Thorarchaeota archaeon]
MHSYRKKHSFSLEIRERSAITNFQMSADPKEVFLIEGYLGDILSIQIVEDLVLEIEGTNGTLRMDFDKEELLELIKGSRQNSSRREQRENSFRFKFWAL